MRNSLKMDVLDELRLFREKRQSNSTFYTRRLTPFQIQICMNMNMNLNLKLESETVERIVRLGLYSEGGEGGAYIWNGKGPSKVKALRWQRKTLMKAKAL
jgi:hypothetical protein